MIRSHMKTLALLLATAIVFFATLGTLERHGR